ncbi:MAG: AAA family ATPase [Acidobacteria bacterium]|nr:AAA family ATPase [Acidobacteriota bacterium]
MLRRKPWNAHPGGTIIELKKCPLDPSHVDGSAAFTISADGVPGFSCHHNGCSKKHIGNVFARFPRPQSHHVQPVRATDDKWSIAMIPSVWTYNADLSWIVDDLVSEGGVTLWTGDSGVGKSTVALAMCGAVVHGVPFLGRRTVQRPVLYVDRENPLAVVRDRLERLGIAETQDITIWGGWVEPAPHPPSSPNILIHAKEHRPLIVFDSLVAFHTGSEQDASETRRHMQMYRDLASAGASVVVLHHTGKAETSRQYRGSSDIKAAVDSAWLLESLSEVSEGIKSLRLTPYKSRIALAEPVRFEFSGTVFTVSSERCETNREVIERIVRDNPTASEREIVMLARGAGVTKQRAEQLLKDGERSRWLDVEVGRRGRKTYRLAVVEVEI